MVNTNQGILLTALLLAVVPVVVHGYDQVIKQRTAVSSRPRTEHQGLAVHTTRPSSRPSYVEGEVLVKFNLNKFDLKKHQPAFTVGSLYQAQHISTKTRLWPQNMVLLQSTTKTTHELIRIFQNDPTVEYAEPNFLQYLQVVPNDTEYSKLWGLNNTGQTVNSVAGTADADIDAPEAWNVSTGSTAVTVAVIDSGAGTGHPDLAGNLVAGYDFVDSDSTPEDLNDHGTHVAGTISAVGNNAAGVTGVNWNVKIMPLRVADASGSISSANFISALNYAVAQGIKIANYSAGGTGYSQAQYDAIASARSSGLLLVVAAGNSANNNDGGTHFYPSDYTLDNIISVAATDQNDAIASFSNYGTTSVDVAAPGVNIYSTVPYKAFSEDFEGASIPGLFTGTQFTSSGTNNYWATFTDQYTSPKWYIFASGNTVNYSYESNSNGILTSNIVDTSAQSSIFLQFDYLVQSETSASCLNDYLSAEVYNGTVWTELTRYCGPTQTGTARIDITSYSNANLRVRFKWVTNSSDNNYYGSDVYYVKIVAPTAASYEFLQGTSMATPHVTGLAALLKSYKSTFTYLGLRNAILNNVDAKAPLASKVVTGGRINAFASLSNVDGTAPTATVNYSTAALTNQNITATLAPSETIIVTNNGGSASYQFTSNGSFDFTFTDLAGNAGTTTATVSNIDKTAPVITIAPYTTTQTNQDITVTATSNEGTLNAVSHIFTVNGSFDFVATDAAGNATTSTVTIANIDKTAPVITLVGNATTTIKPGQSYVDSGITALDAVDGDVASTKTVSTNLVTATVGEYYYRLVVTDRAGNAATAERKVIVAAQSTAITVTKGAYTATFNGKKRTIRPLGTYTGRVLARKIVIKRYDQPLYVFVPLDPLSSPIIVVVDYKGAIIRRTSLATLSTKGFNADAVADGIYAFIAVGPLSSSSTVRVYRLTATTTPLISSLTQANKGNVFVKYLKIFSTPGKQYGLATAIQGKTASIRVWRYNSATNKVTRLTTYNVKKVILSSTGLSLKTGTALVP